MFPAESTPVTLPWIFQGTLLISNGAPEISRITWQMCDYQSLCPVAHSLKKRCGTPMPILNIVDAFTVSLHSPTGRYYHALGLSKGNVSGLWKALESSTSHMIPRCFVIRDTPNLYSINTQPITKEWCKPIGGRVPTPLKAIMPPGLDCATVYEHRLVARNGSIILKTGTRRRLEKMWHANDHRHLIPSRSWCFNTTVHHF